MLRAVLSSAPAAVITVSCIIGTVLYYLCDKWTSSKSTIPTSVNYHFTRKCIKTCEFCFHTEKTSYVLPHNEMQRGLRLLKAQGMRKLNIAGGEPFTDPSTLAMLVCFCKEELRLESVSIITNGTKVTEKWMKENGKHIDVLGVSCDSFDEEINKRIGRGTGDNVGQLFRIKDWCEELGIMFKLNTVVVSSLPASGPSWMFAILIMCDPRCIYNWEEDMNNTLTALNPYRLKVFQVLPVTGENDATELETQLNKRKRNVKNLLITDEQFKAFLSRHDKIDGDVLKPEDNDTMASSYLILDEYMCFLDKGVGTEKQSKSILNIGVRKALEEVRFDREAFIRRGGLYEWSRDVGGPRGCAQEVSKELDR